jgi:hypothetical protein
VTALSTELDTAQKHLERVKDADDKSAAVTTTVASGELSL